MTTLVPGTPEFQDFFEKAKEDLALAEFEDWLNSFHPRGMVRQCIRHMITKHPMSMTDAYANAVLAGEPSLEDEVRYAWHLAPDRTYSKWSSPRFVGRGVDNGAWPCEKYVQEDDTLFDEDAFAEFIKNSTDSDDDDFAEPIKPVGEFKDLPSYHECPKCSDLIEYCSCDFTDCELFAITGDASRVMAYEYSEGYDNEDIQITDAPPPMEWDLHSELMPYDPQPELPGGMPRGRKKGRNRGGRFRGRGPKGRGNPMTAINRGPYFAQPRQRTRLSFDLRFTAPSAITPTFSSLEYIVLTNPNNFTGASTSVPGYTEWSTIYRKFRVYGGYFIYSMQNNEAFGVEMFACAVNFLPSLTADPTRYLSMPGARTKLISPKGGLDHGTVRVRASIAQFGGSANTRVEDPYVGTTDNSSPPSDNLYFIYGFLTNGVPTVAPALNVIRVIVNIEFFELQSPAT